MSTTLGNVKTALAGIYHHVSPKHAQAYLTGFAGRLNRRFRLDSVAGQRIGTEGTEVAVVQVCGGCAALARAVT